ncbi:L-rhamnose mutarotase [Nocardia brasiliensis]|uniref:L-rhamnose mutarotase n=1 Tax=Nocardia brasiliensis TaxID=37326 RepID=A0A6G9XRQ5_NOCBR|nr:L-rhamnose mutarotase [Nocardia brasiliensis]
MARGAELVAAIEATGATSWTIWRSGTDLVHVIECAAHDELLARLADLPVNVAWQRLMSEFLAQPHDYSAAGAGAALPVVWELRTAQRLSSGGADD